MHRFKNRILLAAGFAVLAGVISGITVAPAIAAAVKAALVKNVDERGRSPYSAVLNCYNPTGNACNASATAVPAGKRLVIEQVTASAVVPGGAKILSYQVQVPSPGTSWVNLHMEFNGTDIGGADFFSVNDPVLVYVEAGQTPGVEIGTNVPGGSVSTVARLTGYLIDLSI